MQHPVMGTPETKLQKHLVGVTDEVTIGEKQQLNDVPNRLRRRPARRTAFCRPCARNSDLAHIYVSHIDIFCFYVTKTASETKGSYQKGPFRLSTRGRPFGRPSHTGCHRLTQSVGIGAKNAPSRRHHAAAAQGEGGVHGCPIL